MKAIKNAFLFFLLFCYLICWLSSRKRRYIGDYIEQGDSDDNHHPTDPSSHVSIHSIPDITI